MSNSRTHTRRVRRAAVLSAAIAAVPATAVLAPIAAGAATPANLLVSTSVFTDAPDITQGVTQLPPNCGGTTYKAATCVSAVAGNQYPYVFNNDTVDGSFGVTEPIVLDEIPATTAPVAAPLSTLTVPNSDSGAASQMVTSFPSKSEIALNQSTDGNLVSFSGYNAPTGAIDVSNADTPGAIDTTNIDSANPTYRVFATLDQSGNLSYTETNAYSGNNPRASIVNAATGNFYAAGNAGNGSNPEAQGVVQGVGAQTFPLATTPESAQTPGAPTAIGNFNIIQLSSTQKPDKSAKDDNFRGIAAYNGVLYYTKGSGGNGVNTLYFVDTSGSACPTGGVGVPAAGQSLPTLTANSPMYNTSNAVLGLSAQNPGLSPTNMCILNGFPTGLAKTPTNYPFGIFFANATTLYVADEGSGGATYSGNSGGLEKWTFDGTKWNLAYTLQAGLNLGQPYAVAPDASGRTYPTGPNNTQGGAGGDWAPANDGLRNLAGRVNPDGTVSLWATTSTVSGAGDTGADPNSLVAVTDTLAATTAPSTATFTTVMPATYGVVYRGVTLTNGSLPSTPPASTPEVPWAPVLPVVALGLGGGFAWRRMTKARAAV